MMPVYKSSRGMTLIAAVGIILILSVLGAALVSLLGVTARGAADTASSSKAFAIAQGGLNWFAQRLDDTTGGGYGANWNTVPASISDVALGQGYFDISVSNKQAPAYGTGAATRLDATVTSQLAGTDGTTLTRTMSQRFYQLPSAAAFGLFWGVDSGNATFSNVSLTGDAWVIGRVTATASSTTNGTIYHPSNESVTGTGITQQAIDAPYPSMPVIDASYYAGLITSYNTVIANDGSTTDREQTTNLVLNGNTLNYRNFTTKGNLTISGNGVIVANRNIILGETGALTIAPSGGDIIFLAGRSVTVSWIGSVQGTAHGTDGIVIYGQNNSSSYLITVLDNTMLDGALIIADRRIVVTNARLYNCTLFAHDSTTNNNITISGAATVGDQARPCSIISVGRGSPGLQVIDTASVTGLLYQGGFQGGAASNATCYIRGTSVANRVTIRGSVIARRLAGSRINNATIIYDPAVIPDPPPEGFDGYVLRDPNTWDGS